MKQRDDRDHSVVCPHSFHEMTRMTSHAALPTLISGFRDISAQCDVLACDIWGVLHDGVRVFTAANEALCRYREAGGRVVLLSNAPRPHASVAEQLDRLGLSRAAYDLIVTSGDLARGVMMARGASPLLHIGPERDLPLFDGLEAPRVGADLADYIVCTGLLDDEIETAEDYREQLLPLATRGCAMVCANPDLVVDRGGKLIACAGAIAAIYSELGGAVIQTGKPLRPIYDAVTELVVAQGWHMRPGAMMAIGDALATDIAGAAKIGWPSIMVAMGIHAHDMTHAGKFESAKALNWLASQQARPDYLIERLVW
jgi:HAD superfamily hydrolase (TIGR01459 family)